MTEEVDTIPCYIQKGNAIIVTATICSEGGERQAVPHGLSIGIQRSHMGIGIPDGLLQLLLGLM